jgi:hypothetical protein
LASLWRRLFLGGVDTQLAARVKSHWLSFCTWDFFHDYSLAVSRQTCAAWEIDSETAKTIFPKTLCLSALFFLAPVSAFLFFDLG